MRFPLKTLIIEDDPADMQLLRLRLDKFPDKFAIDEAETFAKAQQILKKKSYDVSIMDINLDEGYDCFDLMRHVGQPCFGIMVFTTKFPRPSLSEAAMLDPYLFLSKSLKDDEIADFILQLDELVERKKQTSKKNEDLKPLIISDNKRTCVIPQTKISYIETDKVGRNVLKIHFFNTDSEKKDTLVTSATTLSNIEECLSNDLFYRIHQSYLINCGYVICVRNKIVTIKYGNQNLQLPIAKGKLEDFKKHFVFPRPK